MCTLAIYVRSLPGFPLVIAANRDEFLDREATGPELLARAPRIVGGRDLRAGGTWLAISERGAVAGLLNRRTEALPIASKRSRGELPMLALAADSAAAEPVIGALDGDAYNAFNLLVADRERAWVAQNHAAEMRMTPLARGLHLISNLDVDDPTCPKIARSHVRFAAAGDEFARERDEARFREALHAIVADHTLTLDPRLPDDALGALCVHAGRFGTRCSSLLFLDDVGRWRHWFAPGPPCTHAFEPALAP